MKKEWIELAVQAAKEASKEIMNVYSLPFEIEIKQDNSPVTIADKLSGKTIQRHLQQTGIKIISEEETIPPYASRKNEEFVWIVDPLDGTKEFIKKNDEFCICIALIKNGIPHFGLIASPTEKKIILGGKEIGTFEFDFNEDDFLNNKNKLPIISDRKINTITHSRSHLSEQTSTLLEQFNKKSEYKFIRKGSALKFIDLAKNKAQLYPRTAPTMEWDIAAGHAIYEGVGGEVLDFSNFEPLTYNKEDLYNPYFIAKPQSIIFKHEE